MTELAAAVAEELASGGVRQAFGVVGGGNILAVARLTACGVRYVAARHEGGAMAMADAYHRATGDVAICTTSHGAGLTNTATGLAEAVKHGSAVLLLCGDGPVAGLRPSDVDQAAFAASLGAEMLRVTTVDTARTTAADALRLARSGVGPVVLCLPSDLLTAPVPAGPALPVEQEVLERPEKLSVDLDPVLDLLAAARRPLLLAGLGAWRSGAGKAMADLAERTGALLTTTVMANGLFAGNRWSLGVCGGFASPAAAELIGEADLVLAFGAGLDVFTLHGGRLIDPAAAVVRVDIAPRAAVPRIDLDLAADASAVASALLDGVNARGSAASAWREEAETRLARVAWAHQPHVDAGTEDRIDPRTLTAELADLLPAERTVVLDGGHFIGWPSMYWPVPDPAAMLFMGGAFQSIGLGFAGAVGAAAGRADRLTVVAVGDGGALMGLPELETLVRTGLPALVVVYDDASYGFEVHMYHPRGADLSTAAFADTDFAGLARSFGAEAATVRGVADLDVVRAWLAAGRRGTLVLDCKIVRNVVAPFLADLIAGH
ncbi:thiamine pyrophosphate-binding protein [Amycolatopsis nigrescens]|uniref:thiamine pyrophosphate-binding protein n=1 Tax=Amycolatopsis nigrescens TaxID=381445 RepID=UPI00037B94BF|nr:thiamine pyrophosphate-binding protein [Amycolatopsis nigrescens]